jgi:hypothetical protein
MCEGACKDGRHRMQSHLMKHLMHDVHIELRAQRKHTCMSTACLQLRNMRSARASSGSREKGSSTSMPISLIPSSSTPTIGTTRSVAQPNFSHSAYGRRVIQMITKREVCRVYAMGIGVCRMRSQLPTISCSELKLLCIIERCESLMSADSMSSDSTCSHATDLFTLFAQFVTKVGKAT